MRGAAEAPGRTTISAERGLNSARRLEDGFFTAHVHLIPRPGGDCESFGVYVPA